MSEVQNSETLTAVVLWCCVPEDAEWVRVGIEQTEADAEQHAEEAAACHWGDRTAIVPMEGERKAKYVIGGYQSPTDNARCIDAGRVPWNT